MVMGTEELQSGEFFKGVDLAHGDSPTNGAKPD